MRFEFEGLDELIHELDMIERMTNDLKDQALIESGEFLKEEISSQVYSHGLARRSGEAQASITRTDPSNGELFVGTQGGRQQPGFYLYMHEFGYYNVRAGRFMAPRPLFSVVFENTKGRVLDKQAEVLRRGLGM